jgi:nicotinamidase-related amidase
MASWWGSFLLEGSPEAELDPAVRPRRGELVVRKEHYSAFRRTRLNQWLRARSVRSVVLCGTMTHVCVDTTARDAFMHGFDVTVVEDACASKHKALHEASLLCLAHAAARIVTASALIDLLAKRATP